VAYFTPIDSGQTPLADTLHTKKKKKKEGTVAMVFHVIDRNLGEYDSEVSSLSKTFT